ncbi:MAG: DUF1998 domain-containing protein [Chloroflexia bacterium]
MRFDAQLDEKELTSLQYALKRGIEVAFQVEDREIAVELLPSRQAPQLILIYEAAEGGAGVLSRLVHDPYAIQRVASNALEVCHFDPVTGRTSDAPREWLRTARRRATTAYSATRTSAITRYSIGRRQSTCC